MSRKAKLLVAQLPVMSEDATFRQGKIVRELRQGGIKVELMSFVDPRAIDQALHTEPFDGMLIVGSPKGDTAEIKNHVRHLRDEVIREGFPLMIAAMPADLSFKNKEKVIRIEDTEAKVIVEQALMYLGVEETVDSSEAKTPFSETKHSPHSELYTIS